MIRIALIYTAAAGAEIAGCFGVWTWLRLGKSPWVAFPALASLALFAWLLAQVSLARLWVVEGVRPTQPDLTGVLLCLIGTAVILLGRYGAAMDGR